MSDGCDQCAPQYAMYKTVVRTIKIIETFGCLSSEGYNIIKRDFCLDTIQEMKDYLDNILACDVLAIGFSPVWG